MLGSATPTGAALTLRPRKAGYCATSGVSVGVATSSSGHVEGLRAWSRRAAARAWAFSPSPKNPRLGPRVSGCLGIRLAQILAMLSRAFDICAEQHYRHAIHVPATAPHRTTSGSVDRKMIPWVWLSMSVADKSLRPRNLSYE